VLAAQPSAPGKAGRDFASAGVEVNESRVFAADGVSVAATAWDVPRSAARMNVRRRVCEHALVESSRCDGK
jgi:hypothetical protein